MKKAGYQKAGNEADETDKIDESDKADETDESDKADKSIHKKYRFWQDRRRCCRKI